MLRRNQRAFRERKRTAMQANEQTISSMADMLADLTDIILRSEDHRKNHAVVRKLRDAIELFVSLGDTTETRAQLHTVSETVLEHVPRDDASETTGPNPIAAGWEPNYGLDELIEYENVTNLPQTIRSISEEGKSLTAQCFPSPESLSLTTTIAFPVHSMLDAHPFALRLLWCTLKTAYAALTGTRALGAETAIRLFQFALLYHSREELLSNLNWFLEFGRREIFRLCNVSFANSAVASAASEAVLDTGDARTLHTAVDISASQRPSNAGFERETPLFWNAQEVELYLMNNGARYLDSDTIELNTPLTRQSMVETKYRGTPGSILSKGLAIRRPDDISRFFDFNALLPRADHEINSKAGSIVPRPADSPSHATTRRLVLQASLLFQSLTSISVCLARGPGYHVDAVRGAVMFAAMRSKHLQV